MKFSLMLSITLAVLGGCNSKPKNEPLPQPPQIINDQKQVLDNTKGVSDTIGKQAEEQRKQIDETAK